MITKMSIISIVNSVSVCSLFVNRNSRKFEVTAFANKKNSVGKDKPSIFQVKVSNKILAQSVVGVLTLGFIDAGYSGDWSRIGVISKESEDLLKAAAFIVVPLCLFLVFSFSNNQEED